MNLASIATNQLALSDKKYVPTKPKPSRCNQKGKTIPGSAREVVVKVAEMCEVEAIKNAPLVPLNAPTKRAATYTGVSGRTIQRIRGEHRKIVSGENAEKHTRIDEDNLGYVAVRKPKHRGHAIPWSARNIIANVIDCCYREFEEGEYLAPLLCKTKRTALYTGVSVRSIQRIRQEDEARNKEDVQKPLETPGRTRKRSTFRDKVDDFAFHCIRMLIDDLALNEGSSPTCGGLLSAIKDAGIEFPYGENTLFRLLRSKGFHWKPGPKGKRTLEEEPDILEARSTYIHRIKEYEAQGKVIVYLDDKATTQGNDFDGEGTVFSVEGGRIIVFSEFSIVAMARRFTKMFRPNIYNDHLEPMATVSTIVEKWWKENLFPNIPAGSVIVTSTTDSENQQLCQEVDEMIWKHGFVSIRLPSHLSTFNPLELIFADIKFRLRDKLTTQRASFDVIKEATSDAMATIGSFQKYMDHVINMEEYFVDKEQQRQKLQECAREGVAVLSEQVMESIPAHAQIVYGKTVATPVPIDGTALTDNLDCLPQGPSYFSL